MGRDMSLLHRQPPVTGPPTLLELFYDLVGRYRENGKKKPYLLKAREPREEAGKEQKMFREQWLGWDP